MTLLLLDPTGKSTEDLARDVQMNNLVLREALSPPAFRASRSTAQTITTGIDTKIQLATVSFDYGGHFDPTTNFRYTPGKPGLYEFDAGVVFSNPSDGMRIIVSVKKTGVAVTRAVVTVGAGTDSGLTIGDKVELHGVGDYLELFVTHNKGSDANVGGNTTDTFLSAMWKRPL